MITIPLYFMLVIYGFFLLGFFIFSIININHLVNTGTLTTVSSAVVSVYILFSLTILVATWAAVTNTNWQQPFIVWDIAWLYPVYTFGLSL